MFRKFGNMDSADEINAKARELRESGDHKGMVDLAKENGIDVEILDVFNEGVMDFICDVATAAIGKLEVEAADLDAKEIVSDWVEYIKAQCMDDMQMAAAVRKSKKSLVKCLGKLLDWSWSNSYDVDKKVVQAAGLGSVTVKMGIPGIGRAKKIIRDYYLGK